MTKSNYMHKNINVKLCSWVKNFEFGTESLNISIVFKDHVGFQEQLNQNI